MENNSTNRKRALIAALASSPIFVSLFVKYFDPIAWYKAYTQPPPAATAPAPSKMASVSMSAQLTPYLGYTPSGVFSSPTKYTLAKVSFTLDNKGDAASQDLYIQVSFGDDMTIEQVTGDWRMEVKDSEGNFKPIEQAKNWESARHYVVFHIPKLETGLDQSAEIQFHFETLAYSKKPLPNPSIDCWDADQKYKVTWEKPAK